MQCLSGSDETKSKNTYSKYSQSSGAGAGCSRQAEYRHEDMKCKRNAAYTVDGPKNWWWFGLCMSGKEH